VPVHGQATPSGVRELIQAAEQFKEFSYAPAG